MAGRRTLRSGKEFSQFELGCSSSWPTYLCTQLRRRRQTCILYRVARGYWPAGRARGTRGGLFYHNYLLALLLAFSLLLLPFHPAFLGQSHP
ncbi:hypothetical protein C8F04DRAFT_1244495 [Mycena alexandri]|uniref:Uncharacterized protein n=1 Tax=Mycena alexandri TaxID=1745969 RepID=A0AAD6WLL4_9AGAR|nr:hypothetical protein C8F04DRAFT_1244495 [Mycena alexandri]